MKKIIFIFVAVITLTGCSNISEPIELVDAGYIAETIDVGTIYTFNDYKGDISTLLQYYDYNDPNSSGIRIKYYNDDHETEYKALITGDVKCQTGNESGRNKQDCAQQLNSVTNDIVGEGNKDELEAIISVYENQAGISL